MKPQTAASTPMLQQYHELKRQHPGALLFFRLGDFYELFFEDAVTASRELEITLTARHKESAQPIPMCGVPHHAATNHIARLIRKGYRVAICEQTEDPTKTKKLVRREVVRVITPGTAIDPQLVEPNQPAYLAALCSSGGSDPTFGVAFLDLTTGEFRATQTNGADAWREMLTHIQSFSPRELLFPTSLASFVRSTFISEHGNDFGVSAVPAQTHVDSVDGNVVARISPAPQDSLTQHSISTLTPLDDWLWQASDCEELLCGHFGVQSLEGMRLSDKPDAIRAAAACLRYARETQRLDTRHIADLATFEKHDHLVLDHVTLRNLEIVESQSESNAARSLLGVIDATVTSMGARLLRAWLLRPSVHLREIEVRHDAVEELFRSHVKRDAVRTLLKQIADLERLTGRLSMSTASPRDLLALRRSIEILPELKQALSDSTASLLRVLTESIDELQNVSQEIERVISDDPPLNITDGEAIRCGVSAELDELRSVRQNAKQTIAALENRERARTGISSLRIRYNNVFGYFIEVSRTHAARAPEDYERRQTLANAERFTTPQLKRCEVSILGADERITEIESYLFIELRRAIATETKRLQATSRALATLDVLAGLADVAVRRRYVRPALHEGDELKITGGRHPTIEAFTNRPFVSNNLLMNNSTHRLLLITGPNMGGKSTILRQVALIAVLAQTGSFVPATAALLPVFDRIWTRVGASDDLANGRSTFMVEMTEAAAILRGATPRSLILLDEIGRGTATFDGLSIAWAIAEFLHDSPEHAAKTLFATHYHELTELARRLPGAKNYRIRVAENESGVTFLYQLEEGAASKSYGIEVARLAGVPSKILQRAREVLGKLEEIEFDIFAEQPSATAQKQSRNGTEIDMEINHEFDSAFQRARRSKMAAQTTLFQAANTSLLEQLREIDLETLRDEEMRSLLRDLRSRAM